MKYHQIKFQRLIYGILLCQSLSPAFYVSWISGSKPLIRRVSSILMRFDITFGLTSLNAVEEGKCLGNSWFYH